MLREKKKNPDRLAGLVLVVDAQPAELGPEPELTTGCSALRYQKKHHRARAFLVEEVVGYSGGWMGEGDIYYGDIYYRGYLIILAHYVYYYLSIAFSRCLFMVILFKAIKSNQTRVLSLDSHFPFAVFFPLSATAQGLTENYAQLGYIW